MLKSADGRHVVYFKDCRDMSEVPDRSVDLVFTSPPYGLDLLYGDHAATLERGITCYADMWAYLDGLKPVWNECDRVLRTGGFMALNMTNTIGKAEFFGEAVVLPVASEVYHHWFADKHYDIKADIVWDAVRSPSGGMSHVLGGYPRPLLGAVVRECEYLWVFRKPGDRTISDERQQRRDESKFPDAKEWFKVFSQLWKIQGARKETSNCVEHPAPFPNELAARVIKGWSVKGDTVLDPFLGTVTTVAAAMALQRRSIGYEVHEQFRPHILAKTHIGHQRFS